MEKNNDYYGGFMISKNVNEGNPIRYTFRERNSIRQSNGWTAFSILDDEEYVNNPDNFIIVSAETIKKIAPVFLELFEAPFGTDICWLYEDGVHTGFFDLINKKEVTIEDLIAEA